MGQVNFWRRKARQGEHHHRWSWKRLSLVLMLVVVGLMLDPQLVPPIGPTASPAQRVSAHFTRCGANAGEACVVDGATFRMGSRIVRLIELDVPSVDHPACPGEAALASRSADRLLALIDETPVDLIAHRFEPVDGYGRELMIVRRDGHDVGRMLIREGLARHHLGRDARWC